MELRWGSDGSFPVGTSPNFSVSFCVHQHKIREHGNGVSSESETLVAQRVSASFVGINAEGGTLGAERLDAK